MLPPPEHGFWTTFAPCFEWVAGNTTTIARRVDALLALLALRPGLRVLELDCATAHHALELARRGLATSAVGEHGHWLEKARRQAREQGLAIELVTADPGAFLPRASRYDAIFHLGGWLGSRGAAADDRRLLGAAYDALGRGGRLVIELHTQESLALARPTPRSRVLAGGRHLVEAWQIDRSWRHAEVQWTLLEPRRRAVGSWSFRIYGRRELATLLREVGFGPVRWPRPPWPAERWHAGELVLAHRAQG